MCIRDRGDTEQIRVNSEVTATGGPLQLGVGPAMLGRVLDGLGRPLDDLGPVSAEQMYPVSASPPEPLSRRRITEPLPLGIRVLDGLLTCGPVSYTHLDVYKRQEETDEPGEPDEPDEPEETDEPEELEEPEMPEETDEPEMPEETDEPEMPEELEEPEMPEETDEPEEQEEPDEPEEPEETGEPEEPEELDEPDELLLFLLVDVPAFLAEAVEAVARPAVELVGDEFCSRLALPILPSAVEFEVD